MAASTSFDPEAKYGIARQRWAQLSMRERMELSRKWRFQGERREESLEVVRNWWRSNRDKGRVYEERYRESLSDEQMAERRRKLRQKQKRYEQRHREALNARARQWAKDNPEKAKERRQRRRAKIARVKAAKQAALTPDMLYALARKAVPAHLPRFMRDDIVAEICLAVLDGKLLMKDIAKEAASFIRAHNREYDTFKVLSLDAPVHGMDGMTYMDRLAEKAA